MKAFGLLLGIMLTAATDTRAAERNSVPETFPTLVPTMKAIIMQSRLATVEISSTLGDSRGTGFLIGRNHVATCFHVVARIAQDGTQIKWEIYQDLKVKLSDGTEFNAKIASVPTQRSPEPLYRDFAILELDHEVPADMAAHALEVVAPVFEVGDDVIFSGYPLATPAMVSHRGMVSGFDAKSDVICIQGPVNKGNSGGALCDARGFVIGIVSNREGGIAVGLSQLNAYIEGIGKSGGSIQLMGVDPLQAIRAISQTLDLYISTGIGYAHASGPLKAYLDAHPELKM